MKKLALALPAVAGLTAAAGLAAVTLTANAATAQPAAKTPAAKIAVYDCANKPQVRPSEFDIFCDGSAALAKMSWSNWNTTEATGTGVFYVDNCVPNCAQGKWSHQNVIVVLWRGKPVAHHPGKLGYSKMTLLYPGSGRTQTMTPPGAY